jgi:hypothetical protein
MLKPAGMVVSVRPRLSNSLRSIAVATLRRAVSVSAG